MWPVAELNGGRPQLFPAPLSCFEASWPFDFFRAAVWYE